MEKYRWVDLKFTNFEQTDSRFVKTTIRLMHLGENLNGSYFSKSVVLENLHTLAFTPILAFLGKNTKNQEDARGHEYKVVKENGQYVEKYIGHAYGAILPNGMNNARFVEEEDDHGVLREYLYVDGFLWTKFEDMIDILKRDGVKGQSMEITDIDGEYGDDGLFHFTRFKFNGACILGEDVQPAMSGANITPHFSWDKFSLKEIQTQLNDMREEFKQMFEDFVQQKMKGEESEVEKNNYFATFMDDAFVMSDLIDNHYGVWGGYKDHDDANVYTWLRAVKDGLKTYIAHPYSRNEKGGIEIDFDKRVYVEVQYSPVEIEVDNEDFSFALDGLKDKVKEKFTQGMKPESEFAKLETEKDKVIQDLTEKVLKFEATNDTLTKEKEDLEAKLTDAQTKIQTYEVELKTKIFAEVIDGFRDTFEKLNAMNVLNEIEEKAIETYSDKDALEVAIYASLGKLISATPEKVGQNKVNYTVFSQTRGNEEDENYYGSLED